MEADSLKMESFGLEILHTIGEIYYTKGNIYLKSQRYYGITGFFHSVKEKAGIVSDTFKTISSALDAQNTMEEYTKIQENTNEDQKLSQEEMAEMEKLLMGKVLGAAWAGSKFEIQGTLRSVCNMVLYDKTVSPQKRVERAETLVKLGQIFKKVTRTDDENEEARIFEELVAEAKKDLNRSKRKAAAAAASTSASAAQDTKTNSNSNKTK